MYNKAFSANLHWNAPTDCEKLFKFLPEIYSFISNVHEILTYELIHLHTYHGTALWLTDSKEGEAAGSYGDKKSETHRDTKKERVNWNWKQPTSYI